MEAVIRVDVVIFKTDFEKAVDLVFILRVLDIEVLENILVVNVGIVIKIEITAVLLAVEDFIQKKVMEVAI